MAAARKYAFPLNRPEAEQIQAAEDDDLGLPKRGVPRFQGPWGPVSESVPGPGWTITERTPREHPTIPGLMAFECVPDLASRLNGKVPPGLLVKIEAAQELGPDWESEPPAQAVRREIDQ